MNERMTDERLAELSDHMESMTLEEFCNEEFGNELYAEVLNALKADRAIIERMLDTIRYSQIGVRQDITDDGSFRWVLFDDLKALGDKV